MCPLLTPVNQEIKNGHTKSDISKASIYSASVQNSTFSHISTKYFNNSLFTGEKGLNIEFK